MLLLIDNALLAVLLYMLLSTGSSLASAAICPAWMPNNAVPACRAVTGALQEGEQKFWELWGLFNISDLKLR